MMISIAQALAEYPDRLFDTENYDIKSIREHKNWRLLSIGVAEIPEQIKLQLENKEIDEWGTPLHSVIARKNKDGSWDSAVRYTKKYEELIYQTPDEWMSPDVKEIFAATDLNGTKEATVTVNYKLPWPNGLAWSLGNYGSVTIDEVTHDTPWRKDNQGRNCDDETYCALDFFIATSDADQRRLLSSADGVITDICTSGTVTRNIDITHADGSTFKYWHIDKSSFDSGLAEDMGVIQGAVFGKVRVGNFNDSCGYASQTNKAHVHWKIPTDKAYTVDGKTIEYEYGGDPGSGVTFTSTNNPVPRCPSPPEDATWTVNQSCYIGGNVTVAYNHNMIVTNNSIVTIASAGSLDVNLVDHNLTIHNGSAIKIKHGGKID